MAKKESAETTVRNIRRKTRKKYSAEEKIRIVIDGLKGESTISQDCIWKKPITGTRCGAHPQKSGTWRPGTPSF